MPLLPRNRSWRLPWSESRRRRRHRNVDVARRYPDLEPAFLPLYEACKHATMTSVERLYALYKTVEYLVRNDIPGDFVECGVWRGGSVMMMALALQKFGGTGRRIRCFDTFEGMPTPGDVDIRHDTGERAADIMAVTERDEDAVIWALAPLEQVQRNIAATGYPADLVTYHKGKVEETLPGEAPERIALLRLDTDWYESTKHELVHLYPRLVAGGVLIVDDYGYWRGSRDATDEYFGAARQSPLLSRVDATARMGVKPG
jgi:O-methyltransferase